MADLPPRITLSRAKGWRLQQVAPGAVIVSRPSIWGNPWIVGDPGRIIIGARGDDSVVHCEYVLRGHGSATTDLSAGDVIRCYDAWLRLGYVPSWAFPRGLTREGQEPIIHWFIKRRAAILVALPALRGKPLACWCKPGCPCHADVLLRLANA